MRRIRILGKALTKVEEEAVAGLAAEAGCTSEEIELITSIGDPVPNCDDEIVLVLMSSAVCEDPGLEDELKKTPNGGRRAVCIWPAGGKMPPEPPIAAGNYAYSIIPWNAAKLRAVIADDDVLCFETPAGVALPKVKMEHNLCVEEKAPAK